jgi:protein Hikeshi
MAEPTDQQPPLFGLLPTGHPLITAPTSIPSPGSFLYAIPASTPANPRPFSHLAVFLLPGATPALPPDTAAAIYVATNAAAFASGAEPPHFRFLGGVGPGKESAVFKLSLAPGEDGVVIGVSVEPAAGVAARIEEQQQQAQKKNAAGGASSSSSSAVVRAGAGGQQQPTTLVLAQRIIKNAFNFLASFSGQAGGTEVVPLKAFEEWWKKFESRVRSDPSFLERESD